jgi:hypothetical protein
MAFPLLHILQKESNRTSDLLTFFGETSSVRPIADSSVFHCRLKRLGFWQSGTGHGLDSDRQLETEQVTYFA